MTQGKTEPAGGGVLIAIGSVAGALIGTIFGETSAGLVLGIAAGVAGATYVWWRGRRL